VLGFVHGAKMMDFFRVSHTDGADLCIIKQDTKGQYLADCIQKCAPGVILRIEKIHKARLGKAVSNESAIIKIVSPPGKALGLDFNLGEVYKLANMKMSLSESSPKDIDVVISSTDALKLINGELGSALSLVSFMNETFIHKGLVALEFNGLRFQVTRIAQLQNHDDLQLQKGDAISVTVAQKD
jgi:hypothetical protein